MNKFKTTAGQLLGISDDWGFFEIGEHLVWLIANPDEIADGYDKSVLIPENYYLIMEEVKMLLK